MSKSFFRFQNLTTESRPTSSPLTVGDCWDGDCRALAQAEGWDMFSTDRWASIFELQAMTACDCFENDENAIDAQLERITGDAEPLRNLSLLALMLDGQAIAAPVSASILIVQRRWLNDVKGYDVQFMLAVHRMVMAAKHPKIEELSDAYKPDLMEDLVWQAIKVNHELGHNKMDPAFLQERAKHWFDSTLLPAIDKR